jgi:hypothetical protein
MNYNGPEDPRRKSSIAERIGQLSNRERVWLLNFGASTLHLTD